MQSCYTIIGLELTEDEHFQLVSQHPAHFSDEIALNCEMFAAHKKKLQAAKEKKASPDDNEDDNDSEYEEEIDLEANTHDWWLLPNFGFWWTFGSRHIIDNRTTNHGKKTVVRVSPVTKEEKLPFTRKDEEKTKEKKAEREETSKEEEEEEKMERFYYLGLLVNATEMYTKIRFQKEGMNYAEKSSLTDLSPLEYCTFLLQAERAAEERILHFFSELTKISRFVKTRTIPKIDDYLPAVLTEITAGYVPKLDLRTYCVYTERDEGLQIVDPFENVAMSLKDCLYVTKYWQLLKQLGISAKVCAEGFLANISPEGKPAAQNAAKVYEGFAQQNEYEQSKFPKK